MPVSPINSFDEFQTIINSGDAVVIDFWAAWCGPCRTISPTFESLSDSGEFSGVKFYKVNVDEQEAISQAVGIRAMPTFIFFKNGEKSGETVGAAPVKLKDLVSQAQSLA